MTAKAVPCCSGHGWVKRPRPNPQARLRLFCLPYGGGGASIFRLWHEALPAAVEVCPVQLPGREERLTEPAFDRLTALVAALTDVLWPHLDLPFAIFGYSMGGLIGFELARMLRREAGFSPAHLFVAASAAPHIPDPEPPIHDLPTPQFVAALRRFNGTPEQVVRDPELLALFLPLLRADFALCETYCYTVDAALACPITAFGGVHDPHVAPDALAAWREHTSGPFVMHLLPGDHFFIKEQQTSIVQTIGGQLRTLLAV